MKKRIAITMGDPAGVGPEVCLHLLAARGPEDTEPVIYGDLSVLQRAAKATGLPAPRPEQVLSISSLGETDFQPGQVSAATGSASYAYILRAIEDALSGEVAAVCTAPIHKEALRASGVEYPGHTEIFADKTKADRACMLQVSDEVTASFVTVHVGHHEVPNLLTSERIVEVIDLTHEAVSRIRGRVPKMACCGLNPHAGEGGLFGNREEEEIITPALEEVRARGIDVEGPLPPDTAFIPAKRSAIDAFICMYHDQGHIPLKALAFDSAVNTTLGLPIVRTSVDHGTACDIAWQGKANPGSILAAFDLAVKLS